MRCRNDIIEVLFQFVCYNHKDVIQVKLRELSPVGTMLEDTNNTNPKMIMFTSYDLHLGGI